MADTEVIKQAIPLTVSEAAEATVLAIKVGSRRQNISSEQNGAPEATRYRTLYNNQFSTGTQKSS